MLFELKNIDNSALENLVDKALESAKLECSPDAKEYLVKSSGGDARAMLKLLEFASNIESKIT